MRKVILIGWVLVMLALVWFCWIRVLPNEVRVSRAIEDIVMLTKNYGNVPIGEVKDPWGEPYRHSVIKIEGGCLSFVISVGPNRRFDNFSDSPNDDIFIYDTPEGWASRVYSLRFLRVICWIGIGISFSWLITRVVRRLSQ